MKPFLFLSVLFLVSCSIAPKPELYEVRRPEGATIVVFVGNRDFVWKSCVDKDAGANVRACTYAVPMPAPPGQDIVDYVYYIYVERGLSKYLQHEMEHVKDMKWHAFPANY